MERKRVARRQHSREFKDEVLQACREPGASVAAVALARGVNANLVHRWLRLAITTSMSTPTPAAKAHERPAEDSGGGGGGGGGGEFAALRLPAPPVVAAPPAPDIRIELRRGATSVTVSWPVAGASECAAWLREWLR
jgi:transposase